MRLQYKFIAFIAVIHIILILFTVKLFYLNVYWFLFAEILIIVSLLFSFSVFRDFVRPLNLILTGIEHIKEKDFNTKFIKVGQPEMDALIDVYNVMAEQLRNERILQSEQFHFLQKLIQTSPAGIIVTDSDNHVISINPAARTFLNVVADLSAEVHMFSFHGRLAEMLYELSDGESQIVYESGIRAFKCTKANLIIKGLTHYLFIIEDLTWELLKTERESYEKVVRMMAHEINNSIGPINSILVSVLNFGSQLNTEDRNDLEDAVKVAITRNTQLGKFMSNFARVVNIPKPDLNRFDLHQTIHTVCRLFQQEAISRKISILLRLDHEPFSVVADNFQLEHVLVNIFKNAFESIESAGEVAIITDVTARTLVISDTGKGIPDEVRHNIFRPFFSTKKNGQGVGLTFIREVLINHNFPFSLQSSGGQTEFKIHFGDPALSREHFGARPADSSSKGSN